MSPRVISFQMAVVATVSVFVLTPSLAQAQWWVGTDVELGLLSSLSQPSGSHIGTWPNGTAGLTTAGTACNPGIVPIPTYSDASASPKWECPSDPPEGMSECRPATGLEMYRLHDGRLEEIGISWLFHHWVALSGNQCDDPRGCQPDPTGNHLGVGCSHSSSPGNLAARDDLGPRHEWNPYTNEWEACGSHFDVNNDCHSTPHSHGAIDHRLRVADTDLDNPGAEYFYQAVYYVKYDENLWDNIGWQPVTNMTWTGSRWTFSGPGGTPTGYGPVIYVWDADAVEVDTAEGLAYAGVQVTEVGNDTWHYEYAVYNYTSNIPFWSFAVPVANGMQVSGVGFHDIDDPEEPYTMTDWSWTLGNGRLTWFGETFEQNPNANALRFGRLYNFWFDADAPPVAGQVGLGLFLPGPPEELFFALEVPSDMIAPRVVHGAPGVSFEEHAFSGYVDPRAESDDGSTLNLGLDEITIVFDETVRDIGGGELTAAAFSVRQTGGATPPTITGITTADDRTVTVHFDRIVTLLEWTTVEADVEDLSGNEIHDLGDLGPGVDEHDRIDFAFLPCDVSQDGSVLPLDNTLFRAMFVGAYHNPRGVDSDYADMNRDGHILPLDNTYWRMLLTGRGIATRPWMGGSLNNPQP